MTTSTTPSARLEPRELLPPPADGYTEARIGTVAGLDDEQHAITAHWCDTNGPLVGFGGHLLPAAALAEVTGLLALAAQAARTVEDAA